MMVIFATSIAISLPFRIAMLTPACAIALLSLMPIPTIATTLPCCCNSFTKSAFWAGNYKEMTLLNRVDRLTTFVSNSAHYKFLHVSYYLC